MPRLPLTCADARREYNNEALSVEFIQAWVRFGKLTPNPWRIVEQESPNQLELSYWASHMPVEFGPMFPELCLTLEKYILGRVIDPPMLSKAHRLIIAHTEQHLEKLHVLGGRPFRATGEAWGPGTIPDLAPAFSGFAPRDTVSGLTPRLFSRRPLDDDEDGDETLH